MSLIDDILNVANNMGLGKPQFRKSRFREQHVYIYNANNPNDLIAKIMRETGIFMQDTMPPRVFARYTDGTGVNMHYKALDMLYLLHKLKVRPSV